MTLGVGNAGPDSALALLLGAVEDRSLMASRAAPVPQPMPRLLVNRTLDPSDGANYQGGSSYSPFLPLLPSTVGLAGTLQADSVKSIAFSPMSYEEAMLWAPPGIDTPTPLHGLDEGEGPDYKTLLAVGFLIGSLVWAWRGSRGFL